MGRTRIPELDLLRFSAAASVLLFHFHILLAMDTSFERGFAHVAQFGFLGVPLFFMISGFVILSTASHKSPREFVIARFCRLYPSYWICVLITSAVLAAAGTPPRAVLILGNLTMFQQLLGLPSLDPVYWTLFVILKFYGLVFILLLCRELPRIERWLAFWLGLSVISLLVHMRHDAAIPGLDTVVFEGAASYFASGCYAYLVRTRGSSGARWGGFALSSLVSVFATFRFQRHYTHASDLGTLISVAGFMVLAQGALVAIALRKWTLPKSPLWYWLGSLTYPLYLLHAAAGKQFYAMLPTHWGTWPRITLTLAAVLAVATVLAVTIEQHGRNALYRKLSGLERRVSPLRAVG